VSGDGSFDTFLTVSRFTPIKIAIFLFDKFDLFLIIDSIVFSLSSLKNRQMAVLHYFLYSTKLGGSPAFCKKVFSYWFIVVSLNNRQDACPTLEEEIASPVFAGAGLLHNDILMDSCLRRNDIER